MTANSTAMASGVKRNLARPERKMTGKKTTMKVIVATSSGTETSRVPSQAARSRPLPGIFR